MLEVCYFEERHGRACHIQVTLVKLQEDKSVHQGEWAKSGQGVVKIWVGCEQGAGRVWSGSGRGVGRVWSGSGQGVGGEWAVRYKTHRTKRQLVESEIQV